MLKKYADFLLVLVAISWGSTFILVQNAIKDIPAFTFLFLRFSLAFLLMLIIFYKNMDFSKATLKAAVILGIFNFGGYGFQTVALYFSSSSIVAFLTGLFVIFTPLFSFLIFKKNIKKNALLGSIFAIIGLYLLTLSDSLNIGKGELLAIICALFYALHVTFTDIFSKKYNIFSLVTFQFLTVSILSLLFIPFENIHQIHFSFQAIIAVFITSVIATVFAFFIQTFAQQYTTPTKTAIIFALEPVTAAFLGVLNGETLTFKQILGGVLVILAMIIAEI